MKHNYHMWHIRQAHIACLHTHTHRSSDLRSFYRTILYTTVCDGFALHRTFFHTIVCFVRVPVLSIRSFHRLSFAYVRRILSWIMLLPSTCFLFMLAKLLFNSFIPRISSFIFQTTKQSALGIRDIWISATKRCPFKLTFRLICLILFDRFRCNSTAATTTNRNESTRGW